METKIVELRVNTNLDQTNSDVTKLKSNLKGAESGAKDFDKSISGKKGANFKELGGAIGDLVPSFGAASQGAGALNKSLLTLVANPIGLVIAGVALVLGSLYAIFKDFQPLVDKVEQSFAALGAVFNVVKGAFFDVLTGSKSLTEAFGGLGNKASTAAKQTMELVKAQQDLDDIIIQNTVTSAKLESQINKLNVQAKNRSLTEEQRLKLLQKSEGLETKKFIIEKAQADETLRIARNAFIIKGKLTSSETKLIDTNLVKAKEAAEAKGVLIDREFEALADALKGRIAIDDKATTNLEKNQNKQDALFDKQQAKREAQLAAQKTAQEKSDAERAKRNEKLLAEEKIQEEKNLINAQKITDKIAQEAVEFLAEKDRKQKSLEDISAMVDAIETENTAKAKAQTEARIALVKLEKEQKIQALESTANTLNGLSDLLGKQTTAGKVAAVASATIETFLSAQKAYSATVGIPIVGPVLAPINAGLAIAAGVKNVKSILSVKTPNGGGGGGSAPSVGGSPSAPSFNVVGTSGQNQIAQTLNREQAPIKAYVVANDVTTQQGLTRNIVKSASI